MRAHRPLLSALLMGTTAWHAVGVVRADPPRPAAPTAAPAGVRPPAAAGRDWSLRQTPVVDVVKRVKDAVVNIHSERTVRADALDEFFSTQPSQSRVNGMGTGIVIDPRGYLVTNQHVVDDVSLIRVRLADGTTVGARVVARDHEHDLALLKVTPPRPLPVMPLGTSRDLQVGETVIAIGNAYGYDHTVTVGVVSAVGRDVTLNKEVRYRSLIQTDASINPGNSGGPLINVHGELIGVNVAIRAGAQGIGFAIPVDTMIRVGAGLLARHRHNAGAAPLGVGLRDEVASRERDLDAPTRREAVVDTVDPGSAAARAGLEPGDVLVSVGGEPVSSTLDLQRTLLDRDAARVNVAVRRRGAEARLELALDAVPRAEGGRPVEGRPAGLAADSAAAESTGETVYRKFGARVTPVAADTVTRTHPQLHGGLLVGEVRPDVPGSPSPAARAGLKSGDVLIGLHQWEMLSLDNVLFVLNHPDRATFSPLRFFILRAGQVHRGWLPLD